MGYGSRSGTPICVQVMNVNNSSVKAIGLVAYLPQPEVIPAFKGTAAHKRVVSHLETHTYVSF